MTSNSISILFVADIVGDSGIKLAVKRIPAVRIEYDIDLCIANGENLAGGKGLSRRAVDSIMAAGVDVITSGNHYWDKQANIKHYNAPTKVLRPANYPPINCGTGSTVTTLPLGHKIAVLNLQGRTFMNPIDCPFQTAIREVEELRKKTKNIIIDFHAEASAEKLALAHYLDGRVSAVIGTHTHVQTADERVLPGGTASITDAGMTGPVDSVIGLDKNIAIKRFTHQIPFAYKLAEGECQFNGVVVKIDTRTGHAEKIVRIFN